MQLEDFLAAGQQNALAAAEWSFCNIFRIARMLCRFAKTPILLT